jgi:ribA/ribD-fused uncharacterized protein
MVTEFSGAFRFLSNFYPSVIREGDLMWPTVEHAYQAAKTTDARMREQIHAAASPGMAKRLGRRVVLREDWEAVKIPIMHRLLREKFKIPRLQTLLLATGDQYLQEGNWWGDTFWGVDLRTHQGQNHLGSLLVVVRGEIRQQLMLPIA